MRSGQYNNRKPKNAVGAGKRASGNEFNTSLKRERHPEPPQYPTSKVDERKQFSESRDARAKNSGNHSQGSSSNSSSSRSNSSSKSSKSSRSGNSGANSMKQMQSAARTVVQNTVVMVAGTTTVLANTVMPELKTTISETFHIDLPTFVEVQEQSGESSTDWLVEGDEPGIFEEPVDEVPEDVIDAEDVEESDSGDSDGEDNSDSVEDGDSEDAASQDEGEQEPPAEPEEVEQMEESEEPEEPEEQKEPEKEPEQEPEEKTEEEPEKEPEETPAEEPGEEAEQPEKPTEPEDSGSSVTPDPRWSWSENNESATLWIPGRGIVEATVTSDEKAATCTEDGSITYTATVTFGGQTYTDTRVEKTADATGHTFGSPQTVHGKTIYHCSGCGKDFEIDYGITEEH